MGRPQSARACGCRRLGSWHSSPLLHCHCCSGRMAVDVRLVRHLSLAPRPRGIAVCGATPTQLAHIGHTSPGSGRLVHAFRAARGWLLVVPAGVISEPADGRIQASFVDTTVRDALKAYHHAAAKTRIVKAKANIARAAAHRVPTIPNPLKVKMR